MMKLLERLQRKWKTEDEKHKNEELIILREHKMGNCVFAFWMTMMIKSKLLHYKRHLYNKMNVS